MHIYMKCKRLADLMIASLFMLILMPLLILLVIVLMFVYQGRPLFTQWRPGLHSIPFRIYKFRTLNNKRDRNGNLLPDEERLTRIGAWLRKSSLDELPQLINVLKGDMSIIGPRPLLMEFIPYYSENQMRRHEVKPGITGLAQIKGRNGISWKEKFDWDVQYVDHISLKLDLLIMLQTFKAVITAQGINQEGEFSSEEFRGEASSD